MQTFKILAGFACRMTALAAIMIPVLAAPTLAAEKFPERPIRIVVGYGAGGGTDGQSRLMAKYMEKALGSTVVVQNMPGAGSQVALTALLREEADGYTIVATNEPDLSMTVVLRGAPYKREDLEVLAVDIIDPRILMVRKDAPFNSFDDFVKAARAKPGSISIAITSGGAQEQFAIWLFKALKLDIKIVGYKSGGATAAAVLGGHVTGTIGDDYARFNVRSEAKALLLGSANSSPRWPEAPTMVKLLAPYGVIPPTPDYLARYMVYVVPSALRRNYPERYKKLEKAIISLATNDEYQAFIKKQGAGDLSQMKAGSLYREAFRQSMKALQETLKK